MKKIVLMIALLTVSGCATTPQPQALPVEVKIPVMVSCIKEEQIPTKPDYESLKDNGTTPDGTVVLHVMRDFLKSLPYQTQLEAIVNGCR